MHIGHYSSFLISKRLKQAGHNPILLVGGGTGLIGDPKPTAERAMISKDEVAHNFACLKKQAQDVFGFEVVNNYDWIKDINTLDFLRDYGKYFNINYMLNKDIVAVSYTHLYRRCLPGSFVTGQRCACTDSGKYDDCY